MHVLFITGNKRFLDEESEERQLLGMMSEVSDLQKKTRDRGREIGTWHAR